MPEEAKIPINAKIPPKLHDKLLDAIKEKRYKDKTECITKGLKKILCNTEQEPESLSDVLQEKDTIIHNLDFELRSNTAKLEDLQGVIRGLPDPINHAEIRATNDVLQVLLIEKDKRIEGLERELSRQDMLLHYMRSLETPVNNTPVIQSNIESNGLIKKICPECGKEFETGNVRRITCSSRCRSAKSKKKK